MMPHKRLASEPMLLVTCIFPLSADVKDGTLCLPISLVPRLSWNANMYHAESLVSFLRKHDVIKIGPGNILRVVQPTMLQRLVCMLFNAR